MINILTSYKGGVGKTTIALAIAEWARANGKKFVLVDTNPQNSNLAEDIFFYFHAVSKRNNPGILGNNQTKYITALDGSTTFSVIDATDRDPFAVAKKIQENDETDTVYIIDTNIHIRSSPPGSFGADGHHDIYTWFLWGWSSPRLDPQLNAIINATDRLELAWPKSQVIHVFNLYDFYVGGIGSLGIRKASTTLKPLKNVVKEIDKRIKKFEKNKCGAVYVDCDAIVGVLKGLHASLVRYIASDDSTLQDLPLIWSEHLLDLVDRAGDNIPYNILLIPTFFRSLVMPIDRILLSSPRSFKSISEQIKPMVDRISVFLGNLEECRTDAKQLSSLST